MYYYTIGYYNTYIANGFDIGNTLLYCWFIIHTCSYGFDIGSAHIIVMSTEDDFTSGTVSSQYYYIQDLLLKVNRKKTPWLIFVGHR